VRNIDPVAFDPHYFSRITPSHNRVKRDSPTAAWKTHSIRKRQKVFSDSLSLDMFTPNRGCFYMAALHFGYTVKDVDEGLKKMASVSHRVCDYKPGT
jgi:UDP-N-acetylmuramyl pentapeptide synthase